VIQKGSARRSRTQEEYPYRAILLLAQASAPLPLDADAFAAALDKARPVDHPHCADRQLPGRGHELFLKHCPDFSLHGLSLPRRNGKEPLPSQDVVSIDLHFVFRRPAKDQGHRLQALASFRQEQAPQIPQGMPRAFHPPKPGRKPQVQSLQSSRRCAQFDRLHDRVLPSMSTCRRTGQLPQSSGLYVQNRAFRQSQSDAVELTSALQQTTVMLLRSLRGANSHAPFARNPARQRRPRTLAVRLVINSPTQAFARMCQHPTLLKSALLVCSSAGGGGKGLHSVGGPPLFVAGDCGRGRKGRCAARVRLLLRSRAQAGLRDVAERSAWCGPLTGLPGR
jgi:hypothetical protein